MDNTNGNGGGGLEDRLRHLILNNSEGPGVADTGHTVQDLPPPSNIPGDEQPPQVPRPSPKPVRKRPNQAQRREMSAQLSIPVDTRPEPVAPVRSHHGPPGFTGPRYQQGGRGGYHQKPREQPANLRPPHQAGPPSSNPGLASSRGGHPSWGRPQNQRSEANSGQPQHHRLYNPDQQQQHRHYNGPPEDLEAQTEMLDRLCVMIRADAEIDNNSLMEKEMFRTRVEQLCREVIFKYEFEQHGLRDFPAGTVELKCFGSLASGFATKASDMDLALTSPYSPVQPDAPGSPIPRLMERALLEVGLGARLLTRTRVPIIKVCQNPPEKLRADLISERMKWEQGIVEKEDDRDEEQHDEVPAAASDPVDQDQGKARTPDPNQENSEGLQDGKTYKELLASHKQSGKTLQAYIALTYKLMRKLGGRDLTAMNHASFTLEEYTILKDVIRAFINGLADEQLKTRLVSYRSLGDYESDKSVQHRTLASVFTQVEGEIMATFWASQPVPERTEALQRTSQEAYDGWLYVQNQSTFGDDPIWYSKELQIRFQRLHAIPSLQLCVLQQQQFESASDYHARVLRLMVQLGGKDEPGPANEILPVVMHQYIAGLRNNDIRKAMEEFAVTSGVKTLRGVARMHKSLQLACDFEKALLKGAFDDSDQAAIKYYIAWLRLPMVNMSQSPDEWYDFVVPTDEYLAQVVMPMLRRLQDPGELTQNKPRDPYHDKLEFPKDGVGVQCDINFSAHLALHNTALLRCYSLTDPRVRPLVLFIKHWAKVRGINNPYRGSLNSYGYVLMVLHYLVNVAQPFVCPNLQQLAPPPDPRFLGEDGVNTQSFCKGANVRFWKDEQTIAQLAAQNALNRNSDSLGHLLRGFFEYYAQSGFMSTVKGRGFHYGRDVISLRTSGGILTKEQKGWTNAKTVTEVKMIAAPPGSVPAPVDPTIQHQFAIQPGPAGTPDHPTTSEVKEIRHRYLLAIEDPFELDHNVARTVTHNGIVSIRDEFRRAWRIIQNTGKDEPQEDLLLDAAAAGEQQSRQRFVQLLDEIHGRNQGHRATS